MVLTCREVQNLLPLFFDSELESRQMRAVAVHSARCIDCERELRHLERLQELVATTIQERVEEIDLNTVWPAVDRRLRGHQASWGDRLRLWWDERQGGWALGGPAFAAAAAGFAVAVALLWRPAAMSGGAVATATDAGNGVSIHSIESTKDVALLNEEDTLVLWVDDEPMDVPVSLEETIP